MSSRVHFSLVLASVLFFAASGVESPAAQAAVRAIEDPRVERILTLVNAARSAAGCPPVAHDDRLALAATRHSQDMARRNYFAHRNPEGASAGDRIAAAGYRARMWGENIAAGEPSPDGVMRLWMNSAGHRSNILDCGYRHLGTGVAEGGYYRIYWTQNFAG